MIAISYAPDLVEEAVLLAERSAPAEAVQAFRRARDRAYLMKDADRREAAFRGVHLEWFARLGLGRVIEQAVSAHPELSARLSECRVLRAVRPQDEGADLFDRATPAADGDRHPLLVLRVRPRLLLDPDTLVAFLRHELMHISDMLDPAFHYQRTLPAADDGPSADNLTRDRYRTLWDVTIDGRLARQGFVSPDARERREREFLTAYPMLGSRATELFTEWFDRVRPTHEGLAEFALHPPGATRSTFSGRCPLCRFPVAALDPNPERLPAEARHLIEREHPGWHFDQGLCPQCLDLYEARHDSSGAASRRDNRPRTETAAELEAI
jgi:hypothetical protein